MMLAAELRLAGTDVVVVERRRRNELESSRAGGLHSRTVEVLDQRGVADRFLAEGHPTQVHSFAGSPFDISDLPSRHPYSLALWQRDFERILAGWVDELGVSIERGCEVTGMEPDEAGVVVALGDGRTLRASYLVGCDGGRSLVRRAAGIRFEGWDASVSYLIAEAEMGEEPVTGLRPEGGGIGPLDGDAGGATYRIVLPEPDAGRSGERTLDDLRERLVAAYGTDFGVHDPRWISRFTDMTRQAAVYRSGRVLLAGDAAHVHSPVGGQGLNTGVQDAVNLGWKLAQVVDGTSPDTLLDTYHAERHPVGARMLQGTMAQVALTTFDDRHDAARSILRDLVAMDEPRRHLGAMLSGLDIRYELGDGHPLVGWRMPDVDLRAPDGPTRAHALLHEARPVLLDLRGSGHSPDPRADRVRIVVAEPDGTWELPVIGAVPRPEGVLIRPDGHVAWAGDLDDPRLPSALTAWFGAAA